LGTLLGGEIANHYGWRHAFIWTGAPGLLLALVLLPFREPARGETEGKVAQGAAHPSVKDVLKLFLIPKYLLVVLGYTAYTFALGAFGFWGPTFLTRVRHVAVDNSGIFFGAVLAISGLVGTFAGGFAATAWQKRNRAAYSLTLALSVLMAVPFVVLTFVVQETWLSIVCLAISMVLLFVCTGPVNTIIIEAVPVNLRSSAMAVSIFMIHLFGDMFSSKIVGRLSDHWQSLQKAVLILPVVLLIGGLFWLALVFRTLKEERISPNPSLASAGQGN
jgi:predicted MFS family arabinose efflux permease